MKIKKYPTVAMCNAGCTIFLAVMLIHQFMPFWELDGQQISIAGYVWFPTDHADLTAYLQKSISSGFRVESLVLPSIIQLLLPVAGIGLLLYDRESIYIPALTAICGAGTLCYFLFTSAFQQGSNWFIHPLLAILMLIAAIASIFVRYHHSEAERKGK